jgi:hypothetical protein
MVAAAKHMTEFAPFLPALAQMLSRQEEPRRENRDHR